MFLRKFLRNSQVLFTNFTDFFWNWIKDIVSRNFSEFLWNFLMEKFLRTSPKILRSCSPILRIFWGNWMKDKSREICLRFLRIFSWRNSWELLQNISPEIPEKFSRLGYQFYDYFGERNKRLSFENFSGSFLKKFLRISQNISPEIPEKFSGLHYRVFKVRFSPIGISEVLFYYALF